MKRWLLALLGVRDEERCPAHVQVAPSFAEHHWDQARRLSEQSVSLANTATERGQRRLENLQHLRFPLDSVRMDDDTGRD